MSAENSASRKTVKPSLRLSWNQSRQVTRLPDQLWKVLVGRHGLNPLEGLVGGGIRAGEHAGGVEDVEALVLHGPHVEIVDRDDIEHIEVVLAPVTSSSQRMECFQGLHGVIALVEVFGLDVDFARHLAATAGDKAVVNCSSSPATSANR